MGLLFALNALIFTKKSCEDLVQNAYDNSLIRMLKETAKWGKNPDN